MTDYIKNKHSNFVDRIKKSGASLDKTIVIGSGILDTLGIRLADDVDLLLTRDEFDRLAADDRWEQGVKQSGSRYLRNNEYELWDDWSEDGSGHPDFDDIFEKTVVIDGVRYITLQYLRERKLQKGRGKDLRDIKDIDEYTRRHDG